MHPQSSLFPPNQTNLTTLRTENSPFHRSANLLCCDSSRRGQTVNCSSQGYLSTSSHHEPRRVAQSDSSPTTSVFTVPASGPDTRDFQGFPPMNPIDLEYYLGLPVHRSPPPQLSGCHPAVDARFITDAYGSFATAPQPLEPNSPTAFGGVVYGPVAAQQPSMPPVTPRNPMALNPGFDYHPCRWLGGPQCDGLAPGRNREMGEHLRAYHRFVGHERDTVQCQWENCGQTMQRMNVPRHIVSRHLLAAASCRFCGKRFSRPDVVGRHERTCNGTPHVPNRFTPGT
ncbi:hypothetical protein JVU11DRAFT_2444 [Chiua virens]|nr:hypothetical protein JVU11DRAFT_2444 [Chiua virens]